MYGGKKWIKNAFYEGSYCKPCIIYAFALLTPQTNNTVFNIFDGGREERPISPCVLLSGPLMS